MAIWQWPTGLFQNEGANCSTRDEVLCKTKLKIGGDEGLMIPLLATLIMHLPSTYYTDNTLMTWPDFLPHLELLSWYHLHFSHSYRVVLGCVNKSTKWGGAICRERCIAKYESTHFVGPFPAFFNCLLPKYEMILGHGESRKEIFWLLLTLVLMTCPLKINYGVCPWTNFQLFD